MTPKEGDLMVWHIPQVPGVPFQVPVRDIREAKLVNNALCKYDIFGVMIFSSLLFAGTVMFYSMQIYSLMRKNLVELKDSVVA
jgi:hypothetical protein